MLAARPRRVPDGRRANKLTITELLDARFGSDCGTPSTSVDQALHRVLARRTCRRYTNQPVPADLVNLLLDVAFCASSKSDYQQASVIVVGDSATRSRIAELVPSMDWIASAPLFVVFCADAARLEKASSLRGKPTQNRNLEAFFNASIDAALVMQTFILAAEQCGLGCCPISAIRLHLTKLRSILALPELVVPVAGLCVGYPGEPGFISMRFPRSVTRHVDRYDDTDLESRIDDYDRVRAGRFATPRDKQRNPKEFGYAEFYGWSEDKSRQLRAGEGDDFGSMVRQCGFTLT